MALNLKSKQEIINKINKIIRESLSAIVVDSCGVNVNEMTELRKVGRESDVCMHVVRNTLLSRAIEGTSFECLRSILIGPTLIVCSMKYPSTAARLCRDFAKKNTEFKIKAAVFEGKLIPVSQIDRLAILPTYDEAIVHLMLIMKEISVGKLIRTLSIIRYVKNS